MTTKTTTRIFENDRYCIYCQKFIPIFQLSSHQPDHELITRDEFSKVMEANVDACISHLKNTKAQVVNTKSGLSSLIDECKANFNLYHKSLKSITDSFGKDILKSEINKIQLLHNDFIMKAASHLDMDLYTRKIDEKVKNLESVKNILIDELGNLTELHSLFSANNEKTEQSIQESILRQPTSFLSTQQSHFRISSKNQQLIVPQYTEPANVSSYIPSNNRLRFSPDMYQSYDKKESHQILRQSGKSFIYSSTIQNAVKRDRIREKNLIPIEFQFQTLEERTSNDDFTFYYDANLHNINLISLPNLRVKKYQCSLSKISSNPSIAISKSQMFICGGYLLDILKPSTRTLR